MFNLQITKRNGLKKLSFGDYYEFAVKADNGYNFYILSKVDLPEDASVMPCEVSAYKGKYKIKPCYSAIEGMVQL